MLQNLSIELQILIDQLCAREITPNPSPRAAWRSARPDIERLLSAQACWYIPCPFACMILTVQDDKLPDRELSSTEQDHP